MLLGFKYQLRSNRKYCQHCRPEASNAVVKDLLAGKADIGVAGIYMIPSRMTALTTSSPHTQDCVTFMTLTSTAMPR
jgi:hypothetical protein